MDNNEIHVVFSVYDESGTYCRHTGTAIASIFANTKSKIHVHILCDTTMTDENKQKFIALANTFKQKIDFYSVSLPEELKKVTNIKVFSIGMMYRFSIVNFLKEDKAIYLDSDIICMLDIKNLWTIDISQYAVGAVVEEIVHSDDFKALKGFKLYQETDILNEGYFNSGVLVFNLKKIREHYDLLGDNVKFLLQHLDAPSPDQDSLNFLFQKDCCYLDSKYNCSVRYRMEIEEYSDDQSWQGKIWHWNCLDKPWKTNKYSISDLYWFYFHLTPWGSDVKDFVKYFRKVEPVIEDEILKLPVRNKKVFISNCIKRCVKEFILCIKNKIGKL